MMEKVGRTEPVSESNDDMEVADQGQATSAAEKTGQHRRDNDEPRDRTTALERILEEWLPLLLAFAVVYLFLAPTWSCKHHTTKLPTIREVANGTDSFSTWIEHERRLALQRILLNIGPVAGAKDGLVVASPSKGDRPEEPDYFYTWTRDSALTLSSLLPLLLDPVSNDTALGVLLEPMFRSYVSSQAEIQILDTPSGDLQSGGLSEPKFHADGSVFYGAWGRPQRDGPALRALSLIPYANLLLDRGFDLDHDYVRKHLYNPTHFRAPGNLIKNDLEEVAGSWFREGYDLWEEVNGHHLWTRMASLRALEAGSALSLRLNDTGAAKWYDLQAREIEKSIQYFWVGDDDIVPWQEERRGRWTATTFDSYPPTAHEDILHTEPEGQGSSSEYSRTGLDCAFPLCVIHTGSLYSSSDRSSLSGLFEASGPDVLGTVYEYIKTFEGMYSINQGKNWTEGWAVGRYREDVYDGVGQSLAHPWFICTFSVAHYFYLAYISFARKGEIQVTPLTLEFWSDLLPGAVTLGQIHSGMQLSRPNHLAHRQKAYSADDSKARVKLYSQAMDALLQLGDAYLMIGQQYAVDGRMSEQINQDDGSFRGARDLTWSYASFLEASRAREQAVQSMAKR